MLTFGREVPLDPFGRQIQKGRENDLRSSSPLDQIAKEEEEKRFHNETERTISYAKEGQLHCLPID